MIDIRPDNADDVNNFLKELYELSIKYKIGIYGCGCCGSPSLFKLTGIGNPGKKIKYVKYTVDDYEDDLTLEEQII